jgi:hypothetical protein
MTGPPGSARALSPEDAPGLDVLFRAFLPDPLDFRRVHVAAREDGTSLGRPVSALELAAGWFEFTRIG